MKCEPKPTSLEILPDGAYYITCACGWWRSAHKSKRIAKEEFRIHRKLARGGQDGQSMAPAAG